MDTQQHAARLSSESVNIVKISILHSMKLYQLWACIVVYGHYTDNMANITRLLCASPRLLPRGLMAALMMKFQRVVTWYYAKPRNESHFLFSGKTRVLV